MNRMQLLADKIKEMHSKNNNGGSCFATYEGKNCVNVAGQIIPATFEVDIHAEKGETVYVMYNADKTRAAIVGK